MHLKSYVCTIWHKFRPLRVSDVPDTSSRRSSPEAKFLKVYKGRGGKSISGIEKIHSMESTMVGVKEIKQ
jgi:hypothetical protein